MRLTVIRHAIAEVARDDRPDAARPLTARGRRRFRSVLRYLEARQRRFDRLVHSPILRAVQTAELVADRVSGALQVSGHLTAPPDSRLLAELAGEEVAVIGHCPWLEQLVGWLVFGEPGHGARFDLKKGGFAELRGEPVPGGMRLVTLVAPRMLGNSTQV